MTPHSSARPSLADANAKYDALLDALGTGFCVIEVIFEGERPVDYRFLETNAAFEQQTGLVDAVQRTMRTLRPAHEQSWFDRYGRVARTRETLRFSSEAAALGRWYEVTAFPVGEDDPCHVGILFEDVTARKTVELERDHLERRLAADLVAMTRLHQLSKRLVETSELAPMLEEVLDATMTLQGADFGNIQLYDADERKLVLTVSRNFADDFLDFFHTVDAADDSACGRALRSGRRIVIGDILLEPSFAPYVEVATRAGYRGVQSTPMFGRDGRPLGMLSTHFREPHEPSERDLHLTDLYLGQAAELIHRAQVEEALRQAKTEAERASEAKTRFLSTISHELRTPLSAVLGLSDIMASGLTGPVNELQKNHLNRIKSGVHHLVGIIDEILAFSRLEARRERLVLQAADVAAIACDVGAMFGFDAQRQGIALRLPDTAHPVVTVTDVGKVRQILTNLLGNAIKFTAEGEVAVEVTCGEEEVTLSVRDTGPGIAPRMLGEIFEPFVQADSSATREHGGTGLGLSICRRQARLLGGDVTVDSTEGEGSVFTLHLPQRVA